MENKYDFIRRHWQYHKPGMRNVERIAAEQECMLDESWLLGCAPDAPDILFRAVVDFQNYLLVSMDLSLPVTRECKEKTLWLEVDLSLTGGFAFEVKPDGIKLSVSGEKSAFPAVVYLEDHMSLEGSPVLPLGKTIRKPLFDVRSVHSGCGIDDYPDEELAAMIHAGYNQLFIFLKDVDVVAAGQKCHVNSLIERASRYGISVFMHNYITTWVHPDDSDAQEKFDKCYGGIFKLYPGAAGLSLCGETLQFPSKDPHTTGKKFEESVIDGIPDTRPAPGWYPCSDYPAYIQGIEKAVHKVAPGAKVCFSTYNWGWAPLEIRKNFLDNFPEKVSLSVCYEIFSRKTLEGLRTPVMDYTISETEPGYYFTSECEEAHKRGIELSGNVNTAGISWSFGTVPFVPVPQRWLRRNQVLREANKKWNLRSLYCTHHYGWWSCVASDLVKWCGWEDFEPDYDELFEKIAIRDYGKKDAPHVLKAWEFFSEAMDHYTASNEDQYGPWRVGPAYPFIFHPNITRTMSRKDIEFPTEPGCHFGGSMIVKTFYQPYENENQSPGFLRFPAEIRSLEKMLALWNKGLTEVENCTGTAEGERLWALALFIRNSVRTTLNIKRWWLLNMKLQTCVSAADAEKVLDQMETLLDEEESNTRETIPAVEIDSRLGWEPSMEYVADRWHLEWKLRQTASCRRELTAYRKMLQP